MRRFHYYDLSDRGRDVIYCYDVPDMPHKSAAWSIQRDIAGEGLVCVSYATTVANIEYMPDGRAKLYIYGWYISATTRRHIRWFLDYLGVPLTVKDIRKVDAEPGKYWELLPGMYDKR